MDEKSLLQVTKEHRLVASLIRNKLAIWLLGYISVYSPISRIELEGSLEVDNIDILLNFILRFEELGLIRRSIDDLIEITELGIRFCRILGIGTEDIVDFSRKNIACDVFQLENSGILDASRESKLSLIEALVQNPSIYGEREGSRYGFVENRVLGDEVIFGYFAQEYWDRSLKYDNYLERREEWDARYTDLLFIWPLKSPIFILQDTRFIGAPTLNMTTSKGRITMIITILLDYCKVHRTGDVFLRPFERTLSKDEMLKTLSESETVSKAQALVMLYSQLSAGEL